MNSLCFSRFLSWSPLFVFLACFSSLIAGDVKADIADYERRLAVEEKNPPEDLALALTLAYWRDQNQEKAFQTFLKMLDAATLSGETSAAEEDQNNYQEALAIYLNFADQHNPQEIALKIQERYGKGRKEVTSCSPLDFIIAASSANLGRFEEFFPLFYRTYRMYPDHYLAHKTKAVLHIKLLERAVLEEERETHRENIIKYAIRASERYPQDTSLYKIMIGFAPEGQKEKIIHGSLNKIIDQSIMVPRCEIAFFVKQAMGIHDASLARRFISKAQEWYAHSQVLEAAKEYVDKHQ